MSEHSQNPQIVSSVLEMIVSRPGVMADEIAKTLNIPLFDVINITEMLLSSGVIDFCEDS